MTNSMIKRILNRFTRGDALNLIERQMLCEHIISQELYKEGGGAFEADINRLNIKQRGEASSAMLSVADPKTLSVITSTKEQGMVSSVFAPVKAVGRDCSKASENFRATQSMSIVDDIMQQGTLALNSAKLVHNRYEKAGLAYRLSDNTTLASEYSNITRTLQISDAIAMYSALSLCDYHHALTREIKNLPVLEKMRCLRDAEQYLMLAISLPDDIAGIYTMDERELLLNCHGAQVDALIAQVHQCQFADHIGGMSQEQLIQLADRFSQQHLGIGKLINSPLWVVNAGKDNKRLC
ncbi:hypothetical protein SG34_032335 [Thalassomonas viridans]|uniref:Uncharacterized protein n=1 Tax=Thalassomonas viridans TaxID=137584 RepID=A0AAF0CDH9_9GAMM|nr:hypothetical protein [Thalassomonas viridans]WDE08610.1 hypothetical protein SG34_032335 [Thalassomonas viridans]